MPGGHSPTRVGFAALLPIVLLTGIALSGGRTSPEPAGQPTTPTFTLEKGDHVCIIGNALAERMQHDGWLEALLQARHPDHNLTIRNLGFSGDEVGGYTDKPEFNKRLRSENFGSADQWLGAKAPVPNPGAIADKGAVQQNRFETVGTNADVIFAFFGYNESFAGEAGLPKFKADLEAFIKHARNQKYNNKSAPRIVLFSPVAFENQKTPNLPAGVDTNKNLQLYTTAMAEVAKANDVPFVDLFTPTTKMYSAAKRPLTINGVHLNDEGNQQVAYWIEDALLGPAQGPDRTLLLTKLRAAILDKNAFWYQRYRATDGYSTFGTRAYLKFVGGQTNYEVVQRELHVIDVMTANRDKAIWAAAKGQDAKPDDTNLPPFIPVTTNKPGNLPGGKHLFLTGEEAISKMTVGKGMKVNLFADETMFPELANPVQMAFDPQGRLWVAVWPTYPHWKPTEKMNDKLIILEDTNGDGKADKLTVFADGLHNPTGFEFYNGGVLVAQAPDLVFLKDTDGDGKADVRQRVIHGLDTADTHHTSNSFVMDPGGSVYFQEGTFHHSQVENAYGPPQRVANGAVFRYEPRTQKFDVYVTTGFANPHGHVFDKWGQDIVVDGTGANPYHAPMFSGYLPFPQKHPKPPQVYQQRTRPCGGMEIFTSKHFPPEFDGNLLVTNCIGFLGILRYRLLDVGASLGATELEPILSSTDQNFRPVDAKTGPDGAIYFIDWQNPIIGHMQHNLRDPSRDREHGRVYRVTYEGRPLSTSPKIAGEPLPALLNVLLHPEDRVRYRARLELGSRNTDEVMAALKTWVAGLTAEKKLEGEALEHALLEALWLRQSHNVVDVNAMTRVLKSPDFRARSAAVRVLCYQRDRIPEALEMLKTLAADEHPRVRMEAVWAASFFPVAEAAEIVFIAQDKPVDLYIGFTITETMKALDPLVKRAIADKRPIKFTTPAGARYFLKAVSTDDLTKMDRTPGVFLELLFRPGVRDEFRREALAGLAKIDNKPEMTVLVNALKQQDDSTSTEASVAFDLARLLTSRPAAEIAAVRADLEKLATVARTPVTRQLGYVSLIAADGTVDKAWSLAAKSVPALADLVAAMPMVRDPGQRAALYPKVEALLGGLPPGLTAPPANEVVGRYVRIERPGRQRTLVLNEVEVDSDGRNVARGKTATMKTPTTGSGPEKAVDGDTTAAGGAAATLATENPWWEVDLGAAVPIHAINLWTNSGGQIDRELRGFNIEVFDAARKSVFAQKGLNANNGRNPIAVSSPPADRGVRRAAMLAITSVRGKEADAFKALAKLVTSEVDRQAAVQAMLRIPSQDWPKDDAAKLLAGVMGFIKSLPVAERTTPVALDMMQFGEALTTLLPADQAKAARKELDAIGVRVIRVGTLFDQMLFDKERLVVAAGKPVEFVFENTDIMPHNFVITAPGQLEAVGNAGEVFATQPGAAEKQYVPPGQPGQILLASRLLQTREVQQLRFNAPKEPGIYPYVCTYPGHWRRMHGALYVVADLDAYLENPEAYLAKNPLPVKDDLLKFNRPRTEWKLAELADAVGEMEKHNGRNFANGKQMFTVATCVACHNFGGQGTNFGPDLAKLDPKVFKSATDVIDHMLDPAKRIEDKYAMYNITLSSGKAVTGMIVEEKDGVVKLIENPVASAKPLEIKVGDIEARKKAATSIMPKGLLDKLTKDEILDLTAYVWGLADPKHKLFQGGGHDHGPGKHHE